MRVVVSTMLALMFGGGVSLLAGSAGATPRIAHALPRATVSTTVASAADCTVYSGQPADSSRCGHTSDDTVGTDGNGSFYRTMISFTDLSIPAGSTIDSATLTIQSLGAFGSTNATVVDMTRPFTPGAATWNTYDGVHGWSTPGGDYVSSPNTVLPVSGSGTVSFGVGELVQPWASGTNTIRELEIVGFSGTGNVFSMAHGATLSVTYTPPAPPTTTTGPVVTTPVPTPLPVAHGVRALRIKVVLSWTWNGPRIRLRKVKVGTMPGDTKLTMSCEGGGCPRRSVAKVAGARKVRRALVRLAGRRYRAGDVLSVKLTAAGWRQERARVFFRNGKRPLILG